MKRKTLLLITVICCAVMTACGDKKTETTTNEVVAESAETVKPTVEETEEPKAESVEPTEDFMPTEEMTDTEEVIEDVDVSAEQLTMADMTEQVIGLDIPVYVAEEGADIAYKGKDFKLLFPSPMYITEYTDTGVRAQTEAIDFVLSITSNFSDAPETANTERNEVKEDIGSYAIVSRLAKDTDNALMKTYDIYNAEDGTSIQILLTINKEDAYLDYANSLIKEFIPALEETIRSNLQ